MVNARKLPSCRAVLFLAALVLTASAWQRGAEYDEQYTLFLTAGTPRPDWPETAFPASTVTATQTGHASLAGIARDLRATDVHPPLYFWAASVWREAFGRSLFAVRLLSVLCGLVSLSLVGTIARRCAVPPVTPMLLTLGCYGFVYTNAIARGFAPAQTLTLCGIALLFGRRPMLAGACLGAACCCNYLAVFVAAAVILAAGAWLAVPAAIPFLAVAAWFFAAQHAARPGQFPPFAVWPALLRSAEYQTAAVFGGLPLYVDGVGRIAVGAIVGLVAIGLLLCVGRTRPLHAGPAIRLVLAASVATPVGLLLLGLVFNNTPIELRYFSFGLPFIALLIAWSLRRCSINVPAAASINVPAAASINVPAAASINVPAAGSINVPAAGSINVSWPGLARPPTSCGSGPIQVVGGRAKPRPRARSSGHDMRERARPHVSALPTSTPRILLPLVLSLQFASIAGLLFSPRTMQPFRAAATEAARLAGDGIVVLPRGNDGVGVVGAFGIEAPASLPILLLRPTDPITERIDPYHRVVLALLPQDRDSTATLAILRAALSPPNWRRIAIGSNVEVYERTGAGE